MFARHCGPSLAIRAVRQALPLWLTFLAAQLVDVIWALAAGAVCIYLQRTTARNAVGRYAPVAFVVAMLVIQVATSAGPPPPSTAALAWSALGAYATFALVAGWIDRQRTNAR